MEAFENTINNIANRLMEGANDAAEQRYLYFAYGSNMDTAQMEYRCPDARVEGLATLYGYKLAADSVGYLTVEPEEGSEVQGVLWTASKRDIVSLDRYEGVAFGCYEKRYLPVTQGSQEREALIYIGLRTPTRETSDLDDYMTRVVNAATEWGLCEDTLAQLKAIAC